MDGDLDEMLLFPVRTLMTYLSRTEQYYPDYPNPFVSTSRRKKQMPCNTRLVISHANGSSEADCNAVKAEAH